MTSSSLLRPTNQKQTICYCKSGECSAPKPEWCIGRRYADGFREANTERVAEHSTPAMRTRIRELARPNSDDYDRAVIAVLDDFEAAIAQSDAGPFDNVMRAFYNLHSAYANRFFDKDGPQFQEAYDVANKILGKWQRGELLLVSKDVQSDAEPVTWREALEQQLLDLVELARDTRSDKGGESRRRAADRIRK